MFESVAAFDGDSTMIKTFPLPDVFDVLTVLTVLAVLTVFVLAAVAEVFVAFLVLVFTVRLAVSGFADVFLDAGIVITPVKKFF